MNRIWIKISNQSNANSFEFELEFHVISNNTGCRYFLFTSRLFRTTRCWQIKGGEGSLLVYLPLVGDDITNESGILVCNLRGHDGERCLRHAVSVPFVVVISQVRPAVQVPEHRLEIWRLLIRDNNFSCTICINSSFSDNFTFSLSFAII